MKNGTFTYRSYDGTTKTLPVRECPDPMRTRVYLEQLTGHPVAWRETPRMGH